MNQLENYKTDWAIPPGQSIFQLLNRKQLNVKDFINGSNLSLMQYAQLLSGKHIIDKELANYISEVLGGRSDFWLELDKQYRSDLDRIKKEEWINEIPLNEMVERGWISDSEDKFSACLKYFGIESIDQWDAKYSDLESRFAFRVGQNSSIGPISAWLRQAEIRAKNNTNLSSFNPDKLLQKIDDLKALTKKSKASQFIPELVAICNSCGIHIEIMKSFKNSDIYGATTILENKAVVALSFRRMADDIFWFTFFHELGHLILHNNKGIKSFLEIPSSNVEKIEQDANNFSQEVLIPQNYREKLRTIKRDKRSIVSFAVEIGVSPGIIIGQMQHMGIIKKGYLNGYKRFFKWEDINI